MKTGAGKKLFFSIVTAIIFLLCLETGLRVVGFKYELVSYMEFNFPNPHELHQIFEPDSQLLWRMRPNFNFGQDFEPLNQQGFRGKAFKKEKGPEAFRIACIGDSVVFGRAKAEYPLLLQKELSKKLSRKVECMNFGVPGYSTYQGKIILERALLEYKPDLVIIQFGWNDHWLGKGFADKDQVVREDKPSAFIQSMRKIRIYQMINLGIVKLRQGDKKQPLVLRVSKNDYKKNLMEMSKMTSDAGAVLILATAPSAISLGHVPDYLTYLKFIEKNEDLKKLHDEYNQTVRDVSEIKAAGQQIYLADLDKLFADKDVKTLFEDPEKDLIHPNKKGYEIITLHFSRIINEIVVKSQLKNQKHSEPLNSE